VSDEDVATILEAVARGHEHWQQLLERLSSTLVVEIDRDLHEVLVVSLLPLVVQAARVGHADLLAIRQRPLDSFRIDRRRHRHIPLDAKVLLLARKEELVSVLIRDRHKFITAHVRDKRSFTLHTAATDPDRLLHRVVLEVVVGDRQQLHVRVLRVARQNDHGLGEGHTHPLEDSRVHVRARFDAVGEHPALLVRCEEAADESVVRSVVVDDLVIQ
jgi:hypothetical protein